jgi:hypothetical protein
VFRLLQHFIQTYFPCCANGTLMWWTGLPSFERNENTLCHQGVMTDSRHCPSICSDMLLSETLHYVWWFIGWKLKCFFKLLCNSSSLLLITMEQLQALKLVFKGWFHFPTWCNVFLCTFAVFVPFMSYFFLVSLILLCMEIYSDH